MHNLPYRLYSFLMKQCNRLPYLKFTLFKVSLKDTAFGTSPRQKNTQFLFRSSNSFSRLHRTLKIATRQTYRR